MQIEIRNYRGIERARIECAPIALVCGLNGAGKTSITEAVAAALTGQANIVPGVTKAEAGVLMRDGAKRGACEITGEAGAWSAFWPGCTVKAEPAPISAYAAGTASLCDMKPKDVAAELIAILGATPAEPETLAALEAAGVPAAMARAVWGFVATEGWDAAHKRATSRATEAKGAWEAATGERWGAVKGASWRHPATVDADQATLAADRAEKESALERAVAARAVDAAQVERWQAVADDGARAAEELDAARTALAAADYELEAALQALADAPRPPEHPMGCPHCGGAVRLDRGALVAAEAVDPAESERLVAAFAAAASRVEQARQTRNIAESPARSIERRVAAAEEARRNIAEARTDGTSADEVAAAREALRIARDAEAAAECNERAAAAHARIVGFLAAAEVLAPTGIRQTVARRHLGELARIIGGLAAVAGWQTVTIGEDGVTRYGGRSFWLLSRSEQFRARVLLQIAIAQRQGAPLVVIDAADILDRDGRNGLFRILRAAAGDGLRALVTMTINRQEEAPNLATAGIGRTYWIEHGVTE